MTISLGLPARLALLALAVVTLLPSSSFCQAPTTSTRINERQRDADLAASRRVGYVPSKDEKELEAMQTRMAATLEEAKTLIADIEYSKKRSGHKTRRNYYAGKVELVREQGGRVSLERKGNKEEYIANRQVIWSVDYQHNEAQFIPSSTPIVGSFLEEGLAFNAFLAMDQETIEIRGSQPVEGEPCWVVTGSSPSDLERVGVPATKIRVWISKNDGLPRLINVPDEEDLLIFLRNWQVNPQISLARFQWSPPPTMDTKNIFGF